MLDDDQNPHWTARDGDLTGAADPANESDASHEASDARNGQSGTDSAEPQPEYSRSIDEVATALTHLAGHLSAGTYRWLVLLGEFDARRGWAREGSRSCIDWLGWKCGVAPGTAREQVRVATALPKLPLIEAAFARGQVSYSKVRAMTRVATPENEDRLLNYALNGTASHVEVLCRLVRKEHDKRSLDAQLAAHANRTCRWHVECDGSVTLRATLPPELGATVVKALEAAEALLRDPAPPSPEGADAPDNAPVDEKDDKDEKNEAKAGIDENADKPDPDNAADSREVRTLAARRADALVHVAESFLSSPSGDTARADERYQVVVHVSAETLGDRVSAETPEDSVSAETPGEKDQPSCSCGHTSHDDAFSLLDEAACHIEGITAIAPETARRIACDASVVQMKVDEAGNPFDIGRRSRQLTPALRRALRARDRGCRFPGCGCERWVEAHHLVHWADGGRTSLDNLVGLCRYHHRLVHEAEYSLAFDAAGRTVATTPAGDVLRETTPATPAGSTQELFAGNEMAGANVAPDTVVPDWGGYAPDYSITLQYLADRARRRQRSAPPACAH